MKDLSNYRKTYKKSTLQETDINKNPMMQFKEWFTQALASEMVDEANAMTLSAISLDGFPKSRVVLLKKYDQNGFVFYTNYLSEKGKAIEQNPKVCLSFFWPALERQIIIKGIAEKTSNLQSDNYFYSRPLGSQHGAIASPQSQVVPSADYLQDKLAEIERLHHHQSIQRPEHWGGFLVKPYSIEFWQGRPNRMHDRIRYTLKDFNWIIERLAP